MTRRSITMVAGRDALGYAEVAIGSLLANCRDPIRFTILTDGPAEKRAYAELLARLPSDTPRAVHDAAECDARAEAAFRAHPALRAFRRGHPCWRKITDPTLFAAPGAEIVVLDPDLVFPNPFTFEPAPPGRLLLMRQRRHCLLPAEVVRAAFRAGYALVHHTDIGVAQHGPLPWDWIEEAIARIGGESLPRVAHVESILWAMIAARIGGGYLSPRAWACWERSAGKRLLMLAGLGGPGLLRLERAHRLKCFHASSGAKDWLAEAARRGIPRPGAPRLAPTPVEPFVTISPEEFERGERAKARYHAATRRLRLRDPFHPAPAP
ncbi:hypothetical protein [Amaricoccus solimangrovi]|uniref:Glycosyltransferase family 2 protein n=1 Tax=Amaricoccus solimangrovi TaxID=2589815 RepID=A0A501WM44_9RHOB|nr:hypothetical protein [Amaricoccus solimangrovi]TPE49902.1 hypothetical protein FJM51_13130 [Amaricoccus solimangrovi]